MPRAKLIVPRDAEVQIFIKPRADGRQEIIVNASDGEREKKDTLRPDDGCRKGVDAR